MRGTRGVAVDDSDAFAEAVEHAAALLAASQTRADLARTGTLSMIDVTQAFGSLPTRNNQDVQFEGTGNLGPDAMVKVRRSDGSANLVANRACFACTIGCQRASKMDPNHFAARGEGRERYRNVSGGLEYESAYSLGPMVGVDDIEAATFANFVCNEDGMDPISFGATVAAAMELYEEGVITDAETGGVAYTFGSAEALCRAAEEAGTGTGFGKDLGLGSKRLCEKYGRPELAMVAKGQEFPGYDGRSMQGMGLAYATSNRGACHLRADPYEDDFSGGKLDGKAKIVKDSQDSNAAIDSVGICAFPMMIWDLDEVANLVNAACEGSWTVDRLNETGERIWNMERPVQPRRRHDRRRRHAAPAHPQGGGEERLGQGQGLRARYHAAAILRLARLVGGRAADFGDDAAARSYMKLRLDLV